MAVEVIVYKAAFSLQLAVNVMGYKWTFFCSGGAVGAFGHYNFRVKATYILYRADKFAQLHIKVCVPV